MRFSLRLFVTCTLLVFGLALHAQEDGTIFLRNSSFEDMPRNSAPPRGWTNCGFPGESPPDVHPDPQFEFQVSKPAHDGLTYLGMVTRENDTYESVGQQLPQNFVAGQCYAFSIQLARSEVYLSRSRKSNQPSNYVTPIKLRVFGGYSVCDRKQLLGESKEVSNYEWEEYRFRLEPEQDYTHIVLEAYYQQPSLWSYNGNILLDTARPLRPIPCEDDVWAPPADLSENPITGTNPEDEIPTTDIPKGSGGSTPPPPKPAPEPVVEVKTVYINGVAGKLAEDEVFAIEDITFRANSAELEEKSREALEAIVGFLQQNDNVIVEIGGHASTKASSHTANTLSENRAKAVVSYLVGRSTIFQRQLISRGYGKEDPVCKDPNPDSECNRRNQRVEVKILKIRSK